MNKSIRQATTPEDLQAVQELGREYSDFLDIDSETSILYQELEGLPGRYAPPTGCLLLAIVDGEPAGCVALKYLSHGFCEMKRLYVRPEYRALGLGRKLVERLIQEARALGYITVRLDTLPDRMGSAVALYRVLGFVSIPPYLENGLPGTEYMELKL